MDNDGAGLPSKIHQNEIKVAKIRGKKVVIIEKGSQPAIISNHPVTVGKGKGKEERESEKRQNYYCDDCLPTTACRAPQKGESSFEGHQAPLPLPRIKSRKIIWGIKIYFIEISLCVCVCVVVVVE